jgi:hypothetical protein
LLRIVMIEISKALQALEYVSLSWSFGLVPPFLYISLSIWINFWWVDLCFPPFDWKKKILSYSSIFYHFLFLLFYHFSGKLYTLQNTVPIKFFFSGMLILPVHFLKKRTSLYYYKINWNIIPEHFSQVYWFWKISEW